MAIFEQILEARGIGGDGINKQEYLNPNYELGHDPFLLPDMRKAVDRLKLAHSKQQKITIYGDYDIDGLTATSVLLDAFASFGFENVEAYIPNRFVEGYGLTVEAVETIADTGADLIITVDCGSLSEKEIIRANDLGVDVIVTDHHNVLPVQPPAVAVINPKRLLQDYPESYESFILTNKNDTELYPFLDLPGVGVAFKLVQAMQTEMYGLKKGQEKWLLDLVALGTVCDVVTLKDENRMHVYWGLKVLEKTRRLGLKALMAVAAVEPGKINSRSLGFALGPRMNAAGRLETALHSLEMLRTEDCEVALEKATQLDMMNQERRAIQDKILEEAIKQAETMEKDPVLVVSGAGWSHGIIGIVAAKLLEKYHKPTFVLEEMEDEAKGSARSYGDFSAADAIRAADDIISKGGGHKLAAGVTLPVEKIADFRQRVNEYYKSLELKNQTDFLLVNADVALNDFSQVNEKLVDDMVKMEPFGNGNPEPIIVVEDIYVAETRRMGANNQHVKLTLKDKRNQRMQVVAFSAPEHFFCTPGDYVKAWISPTINEWRGVRKVEGRLLRLEVN